MRRHTLPLLLLAAVSAPAVAEPPSAPEPYKNKNVKVRVFAATSPRAACTPQTNGIPCEGLERYRTGLGSTDIAYNDAKTGLAPVVMYQVVSQQTGGGLLASQAMAALGLRKVVGKGWVQGGAGIARRDLVAGPRSVGIMKTLDEPRPALAGGVGLDVDTAADEPASLSLDFSSTVDRREDEPQIYQFGASVVQRF